MKNMINKTHIEGYIYEHDLKIKVTGENSKAPGTTFITGTVSVATDDACVNIVPVHFTYVTAVTSSGKQNATYTTLNNIVEGVVGTIMKDGKDKAGKIRIDSAIGLNEFYSSRNGTEELVSVKRNEGGFAHIIDTLIDDEKARNTFECDMVITGVTRTEADPEKNIPEKVTVKGAIFDFRKALLPVEFTATNPNAMNYFEDLGVSRKEPVFTKLWGRQLSETIVKTTTEKSAFGEDMVRETKSTRKDFVITGAAQDPYEWDSEGILTIVELNEAISARDTYLATVKQRQDEYNATKGAAKVSATTAGAFNF